MAKKYKNVLLKISGEILAGDTENIFDHSTSNYSVYSYINDIFSITGTIQFLIFYKNNK